MGLAPKKRNPMKQSYVVIALILASSTALAQYTPTVKQVTMPKPASHTVVAPAAKPVVMPKPVAAGVKVTAASPVSMPKPYTKLVKPTAVVAAVPEGHSESKRN
jgi:hypothetical protein